MYLGRIVALIAAAAALLSLLGDSCPAHAASRSCSPTDGRCSFVVAS